MAKLSDEEIARIARQVGFTGQDVNIAVAVAKAESGGNPAAKNDTMNRNGSIDYGLFQINSVHSQLLRGKNWADPVQNAQMAFQVFKQAGSRWTPWVTYNSGSYRKFLNGPSSVPAGDEPGATAAASTAVGGVGGTGFFGIPGIDALGKILSAFTFMFLPTTWVRIFAGIGGTILLLLGILALIREARS